MQVVNTLLELAFSGPHPALRAGKVVIHITPGQGCIYRPAPKQACTVVIPLAQGMNSIDRRGAGAALAGQASIFCDLCLNLLQVHRLELPGLILGMLWLRWSLTAEQGSPATSTFFISGHRQHHQHCQMSLQILWQTTRACCC